MDQQFPTEASVDADPSHPRLKSTILNRSNVSMLMATSSHGLSSLRLCLTSQLMI